ncbi:TPA: hypothetical protein ENS27_05065 [bacterium]|nr:hypothetical protein [bacterium]
MIIKNGFREPICVISNLPLEEAIEIYRLGMKIEESFRDMKDLLNIDNIMNQKEAKVIYRYI